MRKQLQGRCPEDLCEAACSQTEHGSLTIRPTVEVPRNINQRVSLRMESFEGRGEFLDRGRRHGSPRCPGNMAHRRRRILNPRAFIDTSCLGRGALKMMSRAIRRRLATLRSFNRMRRPRSGVSSPSNQYLKTLDEESWQQQLQGVYPRDVGEGVGRRKQDQTLAVSRTQGVRRSIQW